MVKLHDVAVDEKNNKFVKQAKKTEYKDQKDAIKEASYDQIKELADLKHSYQTLTANSSKENQPEINKLKVDIETKSNSIKQSDDMLDDAGGVSFWNHVSVNASLTLVNVTPDVSFNKNIDGGIGFGYFINPNVQAAIFYDVSRVSQMRDDIVNTYKDLPIPNGSKTFYNSLDTKDNNLFYNKTVSGISLKLIFSLANKKAAPATDD